VLACRAAASLGGVDGASGKAQSQKVVLTLGAVGARKSYTDCGDRKTEKVQIAVPDGDFANARCK
jgi:hypothetical protein